MKTKKSAPVYLAICIFLSIYSFQKAFSQNILIGTWEGIFMNDFKVMLNFSTENQNQYKGNIKMFAGGNMIQDDKIVKIKLSNNQLDFYIPAKETSFKGSIHEQTNELAGNFEFPDGTLHAIQLKKVLDLSNPEEEYRKLKEQSYNVEQLKSDLAFLSSCLKDYHPQLYTFTTKDSMDRLEKRLRSNLNSPISLEKFYALATRLTDEIHCSHTGISLPDSYQNLADRFGNYFPLKLFFIDGKAFVLSEGIKTENKIKVGNEIISINNLSIEEIITQLFYFIPSEGYNATSKYNGLNKRFHELFYYIDDSDEFSIQFRNEKSIENTTVLSCSKRDLDTAYQGKRHKKDVDFHFLDDSDVGILKIRSFAINNMEVYFQQLDSIFHNLKKRNTQHLVLDLRDNPGGHPIFAAQLFSYLTRKKFIYFKRNKDVEEFEPLYNEMQPDALHFNGKLYVFINGGCLSTTGHLISLLRFYSDPIFIGEEPGSTFRCNDFSIQMNLPNTGIDLNVPRTTFETAVNGFSISEAFEIDYPVKNSIIAVINHDDVYLKTLKRLLQEKSRGCNKEQF